MSGDCIVIENHDLRVAIDKSTGAADILDKKSGVTWHPSKEGEPTGKLFCRYKKLGRWFSQGESTKFNLGASKSTSVTKFDERSVRLRFDNLVCEEGVALGGSIETSIGVDGPTVVFTVAKVEPPMGYEFMRIYYPWRSFGISKGEEGYLVQPSSGGVIIPSNLPEVVKGLQEAELLPPDFASDFTAELAVYSPQPSHFSMPWYGVVKGKAGYMVIFESPDDGRAFLSCHDPRHNYELVISPGCEVCKKELRYPRSVMFIFLRETSYVKMSKIFRKYAMEHGYYMSLKDKIKENPLLGRAIGAPIIKLWIVDRYPRTGCWDQSRIRFTINTTYNDVQRILKEMHDELGIDKAVILLAGWGPLGYDNVHPDIWPPGYWAGSMEDLRKARDMAESYGYLFGLHDNYQDIYLESRSMGVGEMVIKTEERRGVGHLLQLGGVWEGGQAFIVCSKCSYDNARRNMPLIMEDLAPTCYFSDTTTVHFLHECYDADHPTTRTEDKNWKLEMIKYFMSLGLVYGSEGGAYWAVPFSSFNEGIMTIGMYGVNVPLWGLVYHDTGVSYWHQSFTLAQSATQTRFLLDLLYGNPTNWTMTARTRKLHRGSFEENKERLKQLAPIAMKHHRQIAFDELVDHEFLTKDYLVQQTRFSSGVTVIVNLGNKDYTTSEGEVVKAKNYLIKD